nr:iron chelate uptake ABC transporter family permease subunit [Oscillatoria laete-virens]
MIRFLIPAIFIGLTGQVSAGWWPEGDTLLRVLSLRDHNTRVILAGVTALGAASGIIGVFLLLRKRSLLSDTISHACLPGVAFAWLAGELFLASGGRSLPLLLGGAAVSGLLGLVLVHWLGQWRIREDAALAIVLSVLFGLGIVLMSVIQQYPGGNAAGLSGFIYGKAASMTTDDARMILVVSLLAVGVCLLFHKELKLLCFDAAFAQTQGWPRGLLEMLLTGLVLVVTVTGLQAVGLLLVVALLVIPPVAARFWTHRMSRTVAVSSAVGAASGIGGVLISALYPKMPAGAVIVLVAAALFGMSFILGSERGLLVRGLREYRLRRRVGEEHLLRAVYEHFESSGIKNPGDGFFQIGDILHKRSWSRRHLLGLARRAEQDGYLIPLSRGRCQLTRTGWLEAEKITRNHRLWELYLIHYADIAPAMVDREADAVEHIVGPEIAGRLGKLLSEKALPYQVPESPHQITGEPAP